MRYGFTVFIVSIIVFPTLISAQGVFSENLMIGSRGPQVTLLQITLNKDADTRVALSGVGSQGQESDYFGALTKSAVERFQYKYRYEVLYPAGLYSPTGFVGANTRNKLNQIAQANSGLAEKPAVTVPKKPIVTSVYPARAQRGEVVTVTGENFLRFGNTVVLGEGMISKSFENLDSVDGKTLKFTYYPPVVENMTESEIRALPSDTVSQIESPVIQAGKTLQDILVLYKDIKSETELRALMEKNGRPESDMYHSFWIIVENSFGRGSSKSAMFQGVRKFPWDPFAVGDISPAISKFSGKIADIAKNFVPTAYAQMYGGGITTGIVMICTCNGSVMTFQVDMSGAGSGLYVLSPGFIPMAGSGRMAGLWVGGYQIMAGQCTIYAGTTCITIMGNLPMLPVGYSL